MCVSVLGEKSISYNPSPEKKKPNLFFPPTSNDDSCKQTPQAARTLDYIQDPRCAICSSGLLHLKFCCDPRVSFSPFLVKDKAHL